jgi:plastocyanin
MNSTHVRHALLGALLLGGAMAAPSLQLTSRDADASAGAQEPATQDAVALKPAPVVSGVVRFKGELPEKKPLKIEDQQATGCCPPGTKVDSTDPSFLVDEKNGLANVVVTVTVPGVEVKVPEAAFELDQRGCVFAPHVQVVPKGAKVAYLNSDATAHNVHLITLLNDPLNQTVPAGQRLERVHKEAETIKVTCDMHTWMTAWVVVTDATHWAVTGADGSFRLTGLPAGTHEVKLWHETLGARSASVTVAEDGTAAPLEVELEPKQQKSRRRR